MCSDARRQRLAQRATRGCGPSSPPTRGRPRPTGRRRAGPPRPCARRPAPAGRAAPAVCAHRAAATSPSPSMTSSGPSSRKSTARRYPLTLRGCQAFTRQLPAVGRHRVHCSDPHALLPLRPQRDRDRRHRRHHPRRRTSPRPDRHGAQLASRTTRRCCSSPSRASFAAAIPSAARSPPTCSATTRRRSPRRSARRHPTFADPLLVAGVRRRPAAPARRGGALRVHRRARRPGGRPRAGDRPVTRAMRGAARPLAYLRRGYAAPLAA